MTRILFILKKREMTADEGKSLFDHVQPYFKYCISSGLRNSASFVVEMLNHNGIESKLVEVVDNNCIDREVTKYKPTHVVIEAFWVVPEKFDILHKLHKKVKWIIRNHSETPFLANDGSAIGWTLDYVMKPNVFIAPNSTQSYQDTYKLVSAAYGNCVADEKVVYLPNYYTVDHRKDFVRRRHISDTIDVGCFGAVRPFKNHLVQAIAAIDFAHKHNLKLNFHINVARVEEAGNSALKNLRSTFKKMDHHRYKLIEHGWLDHKDFKRLASKMHIGLQVSFTESFNIVTADFVSQGIPVVVSDQVPWINRMFVATPTNSKSIAEKMESVLRCYDIFFKKHIALCGLENYNHESKKIWLRQFGEYCA